MDNKPAPELVVQIAWPKSDGTTMYRQLTLELKPITVLKPVPDVTAHSMGHDPFFLALQERVQKIGELFEEYGYVRIGFTDEEMQPPEE